MSDKPAPHLFDHDPSLDHPLSPNSLLFLQTYRASQGFQLRYNGGLGLVGDESRLSDEWRRKVLWARVFVDRLFSLDNTAAAYEMFQPWIKWDDARWEAWRKIKLPETDDDGPRSQQILNDYYNAKQDAFNSLEIPPQIKAYQGDLSDEDLKDLAYREMFRLVREVRDCLDIFEKDGRLVTLEAIFMTQNVLGQPAEIKGEIDGEYSVKPVVTRVHEDGTWYAEFRWDGEEVESILVQDTSSDQEWARWEELQVGSRVQYINYDRSTRTKSLETGVIVGFNLLGAGDKAIFAPGISNTAVIMINDVSGFYQVATIDMVRLMSEEFTQGELPKPIA